MAAHLTLKSAAQAPLIQALIDATATMPAKDLARPGIRAVQFVLERLLESVPKSGAPLAKARLRGIAARHELVEAEGGALAANAMAEALGITRQAVDKRRKAHQLLALDLPKRGFLYPSWQLAKGGVLPGLGDVLAVLPHDSPWADARFFLSGNDRLGGKRPLDLLRKGNVEPVVRAAKMFGEHGAA